MKNIIWTLIIILAVVVFFIILIQLNKEAISEETAKCIGENSILYVQLGCHACETQENMFGDYKDYLETVDCWYEKELCNEITATPTWLINNQTYVGVQSIAQLQKLTGC